VQIKEFREAVDYLTDDEDDMQLLSSMGEIDHTETAEQLLEHFSFVAEEMENEAHQVARNIQGAEEVLAISLDSTRNDLIKLQLFISTGSAFLCRIRPCCVCVSYSARFSISLCTPLFLSVFLGGGWGELESATYLPTFQGGTRADAKPPPLALSDARAFHSTTNVVAPPCGQRPGGGHRGHGRRTLRDEPGGGAIHSCVDAAGQCVRSV
jgi:hypothetical protein